MSLHQFVRNDIFCCYTCYLFSAEIVFVVVPFCGSQCQCNTSFEFTFFHTCSLFYVELLRIVTLISCFSVSTSVLSYFTFCQTCFLCCLEPIVMLYFLCHSDSASVHLYFTQIIFFTTGLELVSVEKRQLSGTLILLVFAFGTYILLILAFLIRDWRWLQLAVAVPMVVFITYWW